MMLVGGVDRAEDIELNAMLAQLLPPAHDQIEGALRMAIDAKGVVKFTRTINTQAHEKVVLLEELAPFVVEKNAVGLKSVLHNLSRPAVLFDEFDRVPEEFDLH
ncbi:hypothetical protein LMG28138_04015 [Pararobbsia alpina]|uniref:Uncharacterized protein n=1 Tax=Pararobbsia alpina TaxID=621374 RepID=A0A6S7BD30_9BURK|nr:hypothetical protein LMG28138_04015 [Pararobbsia alpina]